MIPLNLIVLALILTVSVSAIHAENIGEKNDKILEEVTSERQHNIRGMVDDQLAASIHEKREAVVDGKKSTPEFRQSLFDNPDLSDDFLNFNNEELIGSNLQDLLEEKRARDKRELGLESLHPDLPLSDDISPDNLFEPELYNELAGTLGLDSDSDNGKYQLPMHGKLPRHYYPELDGFPPTMDDDFGVGDDALTPMRRLRQDGPVKVNDDDDDLGSFEEKQPTIDDMIAQGMDLDGLYRRMMQSLSQFQQQQRLRHL